MRFRAGQLLVACSVSVVGWSAIALRLLAGPGARVTRFIERRALPREVLR